MGPTESIILPCEFSQYSATGRTFLSFTGNILYKKGFVSQKYMTWKTIDRYSKQKRKNLSYPKGKEGDVSSVPVGAPHVEEDEAVGGVGGVVLQVTEEVLKPILILAVRRLKYRSQGLESTSTL